MTAPCIGRRRGEGALATVLRQGPSTESLAAHLGEAPLGLVLERTHFPGHRPVQFQFRARMRDGQQRIVLAEHVPDDPEGHARQEAASLRKRRNGQREGLAATPVVADPARGLVLRGPGLDARLPGLRLLHDAGFAREVLAALLGRDPGPVRVTLAAHRLGRRAVLRLDLGARVLYARLRTVKCGEAAARAHRHLALWRALADAPVLRIPEPLGQVETLGLSLISALPGQAPAAFDPAAGARIGAAIAALQALPVSDLPRHQGTDEAALLGQWLARTAATFPDLAVALRRPVADVSARLAAAGPLAPCHRDLHEKQLRATRSRIGVLDFDTLCLGDPALDAGNYQAHLVLAGLIGRTHTAAAAAALAGTLPRRARPGLWPWRRAALLRLAMIHAFTGMSDAVLGSLLREALRDDRD